MSDSAIIFTAGEISTYYAARVPQLKQRRGGEWRGACPIHQGKNDNFAVEPATGKWFCHSQCGRGGDILDLEAELNGGDFPTRKAEVFRLVGRPVEPANGHHRTPTDANSSATGPTKPTIPAGTQGKWREVARYPYVDRDGRLLFEAVRYLKPDGDKAFKQCRPDGRGGIVWNLDGTERVPYRLPKVLNAETIYLPEGEKDVHTLEAWGLVASCNSGGSGSSHLYADWADYFRGRHIVILPDNDEPGRKHAAAIAAAMLSVAASVRIVELPDLPAAGDVTDWRDAGGTLERFRELTEAAAPMDAAALSDLRARWGLGEDEPRRQARAEAADDWPRPIPFVQTIPEPFPPDCVPGWLGEMARAVADATETPFELAALIGLAISSACVASKAQVSAEAGYIEPVNLFTCPAMESGNRKTAVFSRLQAPFVEWEREAIERLEPERKRLLSDRRTKEARIERMRKKAASAGDAGDLVRQIHALEAELPVVPALPRMFVDDCTPEQLASLMAEQGERMAVLSDEGGVFDLLAGRYSKGVPNLDLWLKGHSGSPVRVDRKDRTRPPILMNHPCLTVGISPQPDVLEALRDKPGFRGRGLLARFLYGLPKSPLGYRTLEPRPISSGVERCYRSGIRSLISLAPEHSMLLHLTEPAYSLWKDFQRNVEAELRDGGRLQGLKDWGAKLPGAALRIAGVFHLIERAECAEIDTDITKPTMDDAVILAARLVSHARSVFALMERDPVLDSAEKLLAWMVRLQQPTFTVRDCFRMHHSRFKRVDAMSPALALLEEHYYVRRAPRESTGGRPSDVFEVNPSLLTKEPER